MIALIQRVRSAHVEVDGNIVGEIGRGILALVGVQKGDTEEYADRLLERMLGYRIFPDAEGRMNLGLREVAGGLLLVPQFTLAADTDRGMRPGFSRAAPPQEGRRLFEYLAQGAVRQYDPVAFGVFGADMRVHLVNDGPVTFQLRVPADPA